MFQVKATWLLPNQSPPRHLLLTLFLVALLLRLPYLWDIPRFTDELQEILWALAIYRGEILPLVLGPDPEPYTLLTPRYRRHDQSFRPYAFSKQVAKDVPHQRFITDSDRMDG